MNPLQKKLLEKKYGKADANQQNPQEHNHQGGSHMPPPVDDSASVHEAPKPVFKNVGGGGGEEGAHRNTGATTTGGAQGTTTTGNTGYTPKPVYTQGGYGGAGGSGYGADRQKAQQLLENYNSSKLAVKVSSEYFPNTKKMQKGSQIPLVAMINPYPYLYAYEEFPVANFGATNPIVRCDECRAYVNPFTQFIDNGNRFRCNLCGGVNKTPNSYIASLDADGHRIDVNERAELCCGTYDIKAGTDYMARPPMPPIYFFVLDVSQKGIENGSIEMACNVLTELIEQDQMWGDSRTKVGFLAYDSMVHMFDLSQNLKQPKMVTLTDIGSLTKLPIPDNLLVNLQDSKTIVLQLLSSLPNMFASSKDNGSSFYDAMKVSASIVRMTGGRIYVLQSNPNVISEKCLNIQGVPSNLDRKTFMMPTGPTVTELTPDMQQYFVSTTLFVFSNGFKNMVTMGELARHLGGDIHYLTEGDDRNHKFYFEFKNSLQREYTWETVFRVRVSAGWKISHIYGNYSIKSSGDLLSIPCTDDSKQLGYEVHLDDEIARSNIFYLQTALLYTNSYGERRIRVINYGCQITDQISEVHNYIDPQVIATHLVRQGLFKMYKNPAINDIRKELMMKTNLIMYEVNPRRNRQDAISDNMSTFTMMMLGVLKHHLFLEKGYDHSKVCDAKNALRVNLNMLNVDETALHFVPYLFPVHNLFEQEESEALCEYGEDGSFNYPPLASLSMNSLSSDGLFLMDDGYSLFLLVGSQVDSTIMQNLFGINSIQDVQSLTEDNMYTKADDPLVAKIYNLITELRNRKVNKYEYLHIIREGDKSPAEFEFYTKLIEDNMKIPNSYNISYADFVDQVSKPIISPTN